MCSVLGCSVPLQRSVWCLTLWPDREMWRDAPSSSQVQIWASVDNRLGTFFFTLFSSRRTCRRSLQPREQLPVRSCRRPCSPFRPCPSPSTRSPPSARPWRRAATSRGSRGSSGVCPSPIPTSRNSTRTRRCFAPEPSSPSTRASTANFTRFWRDISSRRIPMASSRRCGSRRTIRRRRSWEADRWDRLTSTGWGRNSPCRGPFGTANRRHIVSRNGRGRCSGSGTSRIPILIQARRGNWLAPPDSPLLRSATGSRIGDSGTELLLRKIGDLLVIVCNSILSLVVVCN